MGYAKLWGWSRRKVKSFLDQAGVKIDYPVDTSKVKKQAGLLKHEKRTLNGHKNEHIIFIFLREMAETMSYS